MLEATITDIEPGAGYEGTTYDQWLVVSVGDHELEVFDSTVMAASESHVGERLAMSLVARPSDVEWADGQTPGIERAGDDVVVFTGRLVDVDDAAPSADDDQFVELDVGLGSIQVARTSDLAALGEELAEGRALKVAAYRVDLLDIADPD